MKITITHIDTACVLININGFKILTDPTLDKRDKLLPSYVSKPLSFSKKYFNPALTANEIGDVDLVLLSHDHHKDNLDNKGREFIKKVPLVLSTVDAVKRLQQTNVKGLQNWQEFSIDNDRISGLKITAIPALHTTIKRLKPIIGEVIGFMIEWQENPNGGIYISGDTVLFDGIYELAKRFPKIETAILHLGAGAFPYLKKGLRLTMDAAEAVKVTKLLNPEKVIPIHYKGWWHFKESVSSLHDTVTRSEVSDKFIWLESGVETMI
ncbi:MBL fold metallo-hydrolase [Solitalea longa]|uniref:MBL fold metallo-hydrolase n=1 Tax=Solitalea longa TaxID=2079460 RepID=A0A2S4ZXQ1_9SPHI|nr:MBL fold metallo-hydrolase [Solitalea longa]POY35095.1 MBL fold metallo-hydrolase [Solitalea longa]